MSELAAFVQKNWSTLLRALEVHIRLSFSAVALGICIAVPLGILLTRFPKAARQVLAIVGVFQTIPSMVMFGLAIPLLGIGSKTALVVLVIYSILPILQNTYTGIAEVPRQYTEAAKGMGMNTLQALGRVEIPLALPVIVSGIQLSAVYIISWATVAALVGAGGLGDIIYTGIMTYNYPMIVMGATPACILAVLTSLVIGRLVQAVTPRGLKIQRERG